MKTQKQEMNLSDEVIQKIVDEVEDCMYDIVDEVDNECLRYGCDPEEAEDEIRESFNECLREVSEKYNIPVEKIRETLKSENTNEENEYYEWW
jgi:methanogenic corrinoid protein MtbC1